VADTEYLLGVDPGGTTGIAIYEYLGPDDEMKYIHHEQWEDSSTAWQRIVSLAEQLSVHGKVTIVAEQFDKRPGVIDPDYSAMYVARDMRENITEWPIVWQIPAEAKNLVPGSRRSQPDRLKRWGWYLVSNRHANDASRHVVLHAVKNLKHMPTILKGWPKK
jgi:hypothetical protein